MVGEEMEGERGIGLRSASVASSPKKDFLVRRAGVVGAVLVPLLLRALMLVSIGGGTAALTKAGWFLLARSAKDGLRRGRASPGPERLCPLEAGRFTLVVSPE